MGKKKDKADRVVGMFDHSIKKLRKQRAKFAKRQTLESVQTNPEAMRKLRDLDNAIAMLETNNVPYKQPIAMSA